MAMGTVMDTAMVMATEIMPTATMMKEGQQGGYRRLKLFLGNPILKNGFFKKRTLSDLNPTWLKNVLLLLLKILTKHALTTPLIRL